MYINFKTLKKSNISPFMMLMLVAIKQKDWEYLEGWHCDSDREYLTIEGYLTSIKTSKKNEGSIESLRLTPKAKKFLEELETAEVEEEDIKVFEWLKNHYIKLGKEIGNGAKCKRHIRDFRIKSGIEKNNLITLCLDILNSDTAMEYNHKLEFLFYKPPTAFETRFQLEESRLYKHYIKHKDRLDKKFVQY